MREENTNQLQDSKERDTEAVFAWSTWQHRTAAPDKK